MRSPMHSPLLLPPTHLSIIHLHHLALPLAVMESSLRARTHQPAHIPTPAHLVPDRIPHLIPPRQAIVPGPHLPMLQPVLSLHHPKSIFDPTNPRRLSSPLLPRPL